MGIAIGSLSTTCAATVVAILAGVVSKNGFEKRP